MVDSTLPSLGEAKTSLPSELPSTSLPPAMTGPVQVIRPEDFLALRYCPMSAIQRILPLPRDRQISRAASVTTNTHSPATQGVEMPAIFCSHMRLPLARSIEIMRPPCPTAKTRPWSITGAASMSDSVETEVEMLVRDSTSD